MEWCLHHRDGVVEGLGQTGPPHPRVSLRARADVRKLQCAFHRESQKTVRKNAERVALCCCWLSIS